MQTKNLQFVNRTASNRGGTVTHHLKWKRMKKGDFLKSFRNIPPKVIVLLVILEFKKNSLWKTAFLS